MAVKFNLVFLLPSFPIVAFALLEKEKERLSQAQINIDFSILIFLLS